MPILLTGATGFVGSTVLEALIAAGHEVTALVRSADKADAVREAGAIPLLGDISDHELVHRLALMNDGVIHTASPGDASSSSVDDAFTTTIISALEGSRKPFIHTGGVWVYGSGSEITEESPLNPPAITSWRHAVEQKVRESRTLSTIIAPGIVYGRGQGIPNTIVDGPRVGDPEALTLLGSGEQHWTTVHVDDLANLYVLAFEAAAPDAYYLGVSGTNPTTRELGEAASIGAGLDGRVVAGSADEAKRRLGDGFGEALLLDQQATGELAKSRLGWVPEGRPLVEELSVGSYARR